MRSRERARTRVQARSGRDESRLRLVLFAIVTLIAAWMLLAPSLAGATTVLHFSDAELTERSDLVVLAEVVDQTTFRGEENDIVYTVTTLKVEEVLAGDVAVGDSLRVRQIGGTLGEETMVVPGDARLDLGERSVFFLADREPGTGIVFLTSFAQSVLEVVGQNDAGELLLTRDNGGLTFYDKTQAEPLRLATDDPAESMTLESLRQIVEEASR